MSYLLNRSDIYCDEDNMLECPNCYSKNMLMYSVEVNVNKKKKEEIDDVFIKFRCVDCGEDVKELHLKNNKETSVSVNWKMSDCEYAEQVYKLFNS